MARALVLGAAGFIGSHLARHLARSGWDVIGLVKDSEDPAVDRRLGSTRYEIRLVEGDALDPELLAELVVGTDAVFPFAGRSGATSSMDQPIEDLQSNGAGQLLLLQAVLANNPDARVVFPGSRLQYGPCRQLPVTEDHPQSPVSIYGVHKALGESYHRLFWNVYGVPTTVVRISNPYGPHQDRPDGRFGVVGNFLARAAHGDDITVFGEGAQLRDYVYIDDLVRLCELAVTRQEAVGEVFNASGPEAVTLRAMAESVVCTVGRGQVVLTEWPREAAAVETGDYFGCTEKAGRLLGWSPEVHLADGLARTWAASSASVANAG